MRFKNKSVIVTGAAGGIGRSTAVAFATEGGNLILVDRQENLCKETAEMCRAKDIKAVSLCIDVTDENAPQQIVDAAIKNFGKLDVAFNNAGVIGINADITEYDDDTWDRVMDVNVRAVFRSMKAQIKAMRQNSSGSIVNTASVASLNAMKLSVGYIAAKHALLGLTRAAALDVVDNNIRINAVCPGIVDTPLLEHGKKIPGFLESLQAAVPKARLAQPEEIAKAVLFLASDDASYMVGQAVVVDGGVTIV